MRMNTDREHSEQQMKQSRWGFRGKTVWDWMSLLIVPLALVVIGLVFTMLQDARQQEIEDKRAQQAQRIENQRAEAERELAEQRAQDEALQAYLDQMGSLLLERDLRTSKEDSEVRTLARARTLTVLGRLDPSRKTAVMQFLAEAKLLQNVEGRGAIIKFSGADLSGANLTDAADNLSGADLSDADLSGANLSCNRSVIAFGFGASQRCSDLSDANLFRADLSGADLYSADLVGANLLAADLGGADLSFAVLRDADLRVADLRVANLRDANLSGADLSFAVLSGANLRHAHLSGAVGITNEELDQQAISLEGATMPNDQKYEDWLKDKEGRKETGANE
jgi:uncharacterized protein YjbI with pentapeptide repeats